VLPWQDTRTFIRGIFFLFFLRVTRGALLFVVGILLAFIAFSSSGLG
jgi:hypothetical protein